MYIHESYKDRQLARFYDLEYSDYTDDINFYVQHAQAIDPEKQLPVLELGCGTGRIAIALAEAGIRVVGIDSSEGMLEMCAKRAQSRGVREKLSLVRTDMRRLEDLPHTPYNMALCALNTFAYLTSTRDQLAMLSAVRPLLVQHGILLLDLASPLRHLLPPSDGETLYEGSFKDPDTGAVLHKFVAGYAHPATQTHEVRIFYDLEERDGTSHRMTQSLTFRWTGRYEMELLLSSAGFKLEKVYGNYDLDNYADDSQRMIFVART
jgi:ubiquinone/menaquinone biosynthesis C-methylase UbiE